MEKKCRLYAFYLPMTSVTQHLGANPQVGARGQGVVLRTEGPCSGVELWNHLLWWCCCMHTAHGSRMQCNWSMASSWHHQVAKIARKKRKNKTKLSKGSWSRLLRRRSHQLPSTPPPCKLLVQKAPQHQKKPQEVDEASQAGWLDLYMQAHFQQGYLQHYGTGAKVAMPLCANCWWLPWANLRPHQQQWLLLFNVGPWIRYWKVKCGRDYLTFCYHSRKENKGWVFSSLTLVCWEDLESI